jgi:hypothetical protein
MPFRNEDTSAFGPEDLKILHDVLDLAWRGFSMRVLRVTTISSKRLDAG